MDNIFKHCFNSKMQGDLAELLAAYELTRLGNTVHISQASYTKYDMLAECPNGEILKVQVKSSKTKAPSGNYVFCLKSSGGNKSRSTIVNLDSAEFDLLVLVTGEGTVYCIPSEEVRVGTQITLNSTFDKFKIN